MQMKIAVKNPFGPSCRVTCPLGFHLAEIHPCKAFSVGQYPINFPMSAWSFMYWIWPLILWLGSSILGHSTAMGLHVIDVTLGISCFPILPSCTSLRLFDYSVGVFVVSCIGKSLISMFTCSELEGFVGSFAWLSLLAEGEVFEAPPWMSAIAMQSMPAAVVARRKADGE